MNFDICLVTYNSQKWISNCLESIAKSNYNLQKIHVYIVDNDSTDKTMELAESFARNNKDTFGTLQLCSNTHNTGFGVACNQGAAFGKSELLFFLNVDTELEPSCMQVMEEYILAHPKAAGYECRQLPFETGHYFDPVSLETPWMSGAACVIRRAAFEKVKGFDPHIFMYCEDVDLSWRLRAEGYTLLYMPKATVYHYSYQEGEKLGEYAGSYYGNLLLRYKFGSFLDILRGEYLYLKTLWRPRHFANVRKVMAKNYLRHFIRLWPFLGWRFRHRHQFKQKTAQFKGGFAADRGHYRLTPLANLPLVSVILQCGGEGSLEPVLVSIANQTYTNLEIIIINAAPVDEVMEKHGFHKDKEKIRPQIANISRAMSAYSGIQNAKGQYCLFADTNSRLFPDHVEVLVAEACKHPGAPCILGSQMVVTDYHNGWPAAVHRADNPLPIETALFKADLFRGWDAASFPATKKEWQRWIEKEKNTPAIERMTTVFYKKNKVTPLS